ncbi:hypothetical protein LUZ60_006997 [Juncus effusus]|nr:hypothetical protein LUZ60_006997 [Juncus effusus]
MGIRREEVISHPFSDELSSNGSSSPEREEFENCSNDSSDLGNCIAHEVSKMDTLAGIAIKYGVQIADIKRMNNLVSDRQMFAHKSLLIPLSSRFTPSPLHSSRSAPNINRDLTPKSSINKPNSYSNSKPPACNSSPAMSILQRYYNLKPDLSSQKGSEMEMSLFNEEGKNGNNKKETMRRRQKTENDSSTQPELEESGFNNFISKVLLPLRPKTGIFDADLSICDPLLVNGLNFVKKSTSAASLSEVISRPFLVRNKAALD